MTKLRAFQHSAFEKLFDLFRKKYYSLGRMSGTVSLTNFSPEEVEEIAGFLAIPANTLARKGAVSLQNFEQQLKLTSFANFSLQQLLEQYFGEALMTKLQALDEKSKVEQGFLEALQHILEPSPAWLSQILKKEPDSRFIWQSNHEILRDLELTVKAIINHLPVGQYERLPIFAQRTTGNPHAFDHNTLLGKLLVHAAYSLSVESNYPKSTAERVELLSQFGIVQDDLWNFVTCQGLLASLNGQVHPVWQAALDERSVMNVPMRELLKVEKIIVPRHPCVWIVENSSVASTLMDAHPTAPIICTHGQLRMASWRLLALLDSQVKIFYAGDLDPEGLQIAQKIVNKYGNRVQLWRMDSASYEKGMGEALSTISMAKLESISILPDVVEKIKHYKKASYQEAWLLEMIEDIKGNN